MKKAILIIASIVLLVSVNFAFAESTKTSPFDAIWAAIQSLQEQIENIQLIPGPQGEKGEKGDAGEQGPAGEPSWDETRIANLEERVSYLESLLPMKL